MLANNSVERGSYTKSHRNYYLKFQYHDWDKRHSFQNDISKKNWNFALVITKTALNTLFWLYFLDLAKNQDFETWPFFFNFQFSQL